MNKKVKIALAIGVPLALGGLYFGVVRNRRPKLTFENIDWIGQKGVYKFGSTENSFNTSGGAGVVAGATYSNKYGLSVKGNPNEKKVIFEVINNKTGQVVETATIDFVSKLKY